MRTLLLDSSFSPVEVIDWKRAIILLITGRAEAIDSYDEINIRSPRTTFQLPKTLRLFNLHRSSRTVKFSRFNVIFRDNFECQYCGKNGSVKELTIDHVIPISRGGKNTWENVVTACKTCNLQKSDKDIRPKVDPVKPTLKHLIRGHQIDKSNFPDMEWNKYSFQS